jgi:hypothetical protein
MPSMMTRIARLAGSPQGQKLANQAKRFMSDPQKRDKIEGYRRKLSNRRAH